MMTDLLKSISLSTGFNLQAQMPLDPRLVVQSKTDITSMANILKYPGMSIYCIDDDIQYQLAKNGKWKVEHAGFCTGRGAPAATVGLIGDMYIDKDKSDIYLKLITDTTTLAAEWTYVTNIKGGKGDQGIQGVTGTRGSMWFTGILITGIDVNGNVFPTSGITSANLGDLYYNIETCYVYKCVLAGNADAAKWAYIGSLRGEKGAQGIQGIQGIQGLPGAQGVPGIQGNKGEDGANLAAGPLLVGPTAEGGQIFPELVGKDDTNYKINDYYISGVNGDAYIATTAGKIHEVKWKRIFNIFGYNLNVGIEITGTGQNVIFPGNHIGYSNMNDIYLNTNTQDMYQCTKEGDASVATWSFIATLRGATGDRGPTGERGVDGQMGNSVRMTSDKLVASSSANVSAHLSNTDHLTVHDLVLDSGYNMFEITALSVDKTTYTIGVSLGCIRGAGIESATERITIPATRWHADLAAFETTVVLKSITITENTDIYISPVKDQSNLDSIINHEIYANTQHNDINALTFWASTQPTIAAEFDVRIVIYPAKGVN